MKYKLTNTNVVVRQDGTQIPFDPDNTDYQAYLKWIDGYEMVNGELIKTSEGNTPLPADEA
jgi:hypothetical protein